MKNWTMVLGLIVTSNAALAGQDVWLNEFRATEQMCQRLTEGVTPEAQRKANVKLDAEQCYAWFLHSQLLAEPRQQESVLKAALLVNEQRVSTVVQTAIKAGVPPMQVVALAGQTQPKYRTEIARAAIAAGVDPSLVTEATAAGKSSE